MRCLTRGRHFRSLLPSISQSGSKFFFRQRSLRQFTNTIERRRYSYQVVECRAKDLNSIASLKDDNHENQHIIAGKYPKATFYGMNKESPRWTVIQRPDNKGFSFASSFGATDLQHAFFENIIKHFLPAQYPQSVAEGYARFSLLAFSASLAGSSAMVLSTQTLLLAVGVVGNSAAAAGTASIMAGALNWVLKDGIGQLGGVIFASKMGETKKFDADPKRWRMVAALSLDFSSLLEILSPLVYSSWVLPIACVANIGKNIGFLTASASRAAIHQSLALHGNLADVTAKAASQSMAAGLLGTAAGIGLSHLLQHDATNFIMGFCVCSLVHQGCNYASLKSVPLLHFNRHRLHLLLCHYVATGSVLAPHQIAEQERFFPLSFHSDDSRSWLMVGTSLRESCPDDSSNFHELYSILHSENYLLSVVDNHIHLVFSSNASGDDVVMGMYHAHLLRKVLSALSTDDKLQMIKSTLVTAKEGVSQLREELYTKGWKTETDVTNIETSQAHRFYLLTGDRQ